MALKSDCMLTGYYHRPDLTEKAFLDGWYLTGDLGYIADGEVFVSGRKKDMIISEGFNIYPREIEEFLLTHPKVADASVIGMPDKIRGERVYAFVVLKENVAVTPDEIAQDAVRAYEAGAAVIHIHLRDNDEFTTDLGVARRTASGGRGAFGAIGLSIVSQAGIGSVTTSVEDGGTELVFNFTGFDAGEKLVERRDWNPERPPRPKFRNLNPEQQAEAGGDDRRDPQGLEDAQQRRLGIECAVLGPEVEGEIDRQHRKAAGVDRRHHAGTEGIAEREIGGDLGQPFTDQNLEFHDLVVPGKIAAARGRPDGDDLRAA